MPKRTRLVLILAVTGAGAIVAALVAYLTVSSGAANSTGVALRTVGMSAGRMVVTGTGSTVYIYLPDSSSPPGSVCTADCANDWPPVRPGAPSPTVSGMPAGRIGEFNRPDGTRQLTLLGHPLYTYAGDRRSGDTRGEAVGGTWFAVGPDGSLLDLPPSGFAARGTPSTQLLTVVSTPDGEAVADDKGQTLYTYRDDTPGTSACTPAWCVQDWPPLTVKQPPGPLPGITAELGVIQRPDGTLQLTLAGHPLYRFSGDEHPGEVRGLGIGGDWFPISPAGGAVAKRATG